MVRILAPLVLSVLLASLPAADSAAQAPVGEPAGQGSGKAPGEEKRETEEDPASRGQPRRDSDSGKRPERPEGQRDEAGIEQRVREIEEALWSEVSALETRLAGLRERLRRWSGERAQGEEAPLDAAHTEEHARLIHRQEELVGRWKELARPRSDRRESKEAFEVRNEEAQRVRRELREVLGRMLDLREQARERQVQRLRRELEKLERLLAERRKASGRDSAVETRLRDLLGESPRR